MITAQQDSVLETQIRRIQTDRPFRSLICLLCMAAFQFLSPHPWVTAIGIAGLALDLVGIRLEQRLVRRRSYGLYIGYCVLQGIATALIVTPFSLRIPEGSAGHAIVAQGIIWVLLMNCLVRRSGKVYLMAASSFPIGVGILIGALNSSAQFSSIGVSVTLIAMCFTLFFYALALIWQAMVQATEQAADRMRADRAAESRNRFFDTVNHEIRTPLNGIMGMAQIIRSEARTAEQIERARSLTESTAMLKALTDDLLDHAKLREGQFRITPQVLDVRDLIDDAVALYRDTATDQDLAITAEVEPEVPPGVWADPVRLRQILCNLIHNALKHTRIGGVTVNARSIRRGGLHWIDLSVRDTGCGIPEGRRDTIFAPFEQLDDDAARSGKGTGLGLSIARDLVEMMGGKITVTSEVGIGSTFRVAIPAPTVDTIHAARKPDHHPVAGGALDGVRVMVVDDSRINRLVARTFLEQDGATVIEASDGLKALTILRRASVDAVLMDLHMPRMDGSETLRRIRSIYGDGGPKVILLSASDGTDPTQFDAVLSKPLDRASLVVAVRPDASDRNTDASDGLRDAS